MIEISNKNYLQGLTDLEIIKAPTYDLTILSDLVSERKMDKPTGKLMYLDVSDK